MWSDFWVFGSYFCDLSTSEGINQQAVGRIVAAREVVSSVGLAQPFSLSAVSVALCRSAALSLVRLTAFACVRIGVRGDDPLRGVRLPRVPAARYLYCMEGGYRLSIADLPSRRLLADAAQLRCAEPHQPLPASARRISLQRRRHPPGEGNRTPVSNAFIHHGCSSYPSFRVFHSRFRLNLMAHLSADNCVGRSSSSSWCLSSSWRISHHASPWEP